MSNNLHQQIYNNLNLKDTDELLSIWVNNDRSVWSDEAIQAIEEILEKRNVEFPLREASIRDEIEDEVTKYNPDDLTDEEKIILDDEYPPDFYNPFEVLRISKWGEILAIVSIVVALVSSLLQFTGTRNIAMSYFPQSSSGYIIGYVIAMVSVSLAVISAFIFTYFPLKIMANILKILMEMEFNSRK